VQYIETTLSIKNRHKIVEPNGQCKDNLLLPSVCLLRLAASTWQVVRLAASQPAGAVARMAIGHLVQNCSNHVLEDIGVVCTLYGTRSLYIYYTKRQWKFSSAIHIFRSS
jgi:hypothetical protein